MKDILLRSPEQLGAVIRQRRKDEGISQAALAELLGVERKWVIRLEAGNPGAEFGLVLKVLLALHIRASLSFGGIPASDARRESGRSSRLDEVFQRLQKSHSK